MFKIGDVVRISKDYPHADEVHSPSGYIAGMRGIKASILDVYKNWKGVTMYMIKLGSPVCGNDIDYVEEEDLEECVEVCKG